MPALIAFVQILRGHANMGVDFTGGTLLQYRTAAPFSLEEVRGHLRDQGFTGIDLQQVTSENQLIVKVKQSEEKIGNLSDRITTSLAGKEFGAGFTLESKSEIGASVSADLRSKAIIQ